MDDAVCGEFSQTNSSATWHEGCSLDQPGIPVYVWCVKFNRITDRVQCMLSPPQAGLFGLIDCFRLRMPWSTHFPPFLRILLAVLPPLMPRSSHKTALALRPPASPKRLWLPTAQGRAGGASLAEQHFPGNLHKPLGQPSARLHQLNIVLRRSKMRAPCGKD